jgi:hypothetical protein
MATELVNSITSQVWVPDGITVEDRRQPGPDRWDHQG